MPPLVDLRAAASVAAGNAPDVSAQQTFVRKPAAIVAENIPPIPAGSAQATRRYLASRRARFASWHRANRSRLIATRPSAGVTA